MAAMSGWLYDDDRPLDYLRYEDALAELKARARRGASSAAARARLRRRALAEVEIAPVEEGDAAEEAAELAALRAGMSEKDLEAVRGGRRAARRAGGAGLPRRPSPRCRASASPTSRPPAAEPEAQDVEPLPCLAHELDTHGIDYVYHYFDLRRLDFGDLPWVGVLTDLLGKLDTARHAGLRPRHRRGDQSRRARLLHRDLRPRRRPLLRRPLARGGRLALSEKVDALAELPSEVWGTTRFDDLARVRDILTQRRVALEQYFVSSGHTAAAARANTYFSSAAMASSAMSGLEYYLFLRDLLDGWDERSAELPGRLAELAARVHGRRRRRELHRLRRKPRALLGGGRRARPGAHGPREHRPGPPPTPATRPSSSPPT